MAHNPTNNVMQRIGDEEMLWEKGLLGDATPQTLLDTMVFCNGLYFALRSGREHRQLKMNPCQIELVEPCDDRPYLKYTEDISKNRPGGIKGRKIKPKVVPTSPIQRDVL